MLKKIIQIFGVIAKQLAVAFFFACFLIVIINLTCGNKIQRYISLINMITVMDKTGEDSESQEISFDSVKKKLASYPSWGTIWATLNIPSINMEAPVYQGDTLDIIKYGIGHYAGSYYPGEGSTIIFAAHNSSQHFMRLPQLKIGDKVIVYASYGTYTYEVTNTKIIKDTDTDSLAIQTDKEELIMYTCYPVNVVGHKDKRYVVYAKLVGEEHES